MLLAPQGEALLEDLITCWTVQADCKNGARGGWRLARIAATAVRRSVKERAASRVEAGVRPVLETPQNDVDVDCGFKEKDIVDVNVTPESQIQKLPREERTMRRQVSCGGKIPQKESGLASSVPLQC